MKTLPLLALLIPLSWYPVSAQTPPKGPPLDAEALLNQTELNVLTRQYEKALTECYELRLQREMLATASDSPREALEHKANQIEQRLKVMENWREEIRRRIVHLVAEQDARERGREQRRIEENLKANPAFPPATKSNPPSAR
jgi:hypothetical protein